jgi:hypothetical protein
MNQDTETDFAIVRAGLACAPSSSTNTAACGALVRVSEAFALLEADARALWAVRVLDAQGDWEMHPGPRVHSELSCVFTGMGTPGACHYGKDAQAARDAAAQAVFPTLHADVRAKLGERP